EILTLRYVDDLDPKDIAVILDITPNNVSVRLNRAMHELKKLMDPHA
ncbi:MAG: Sigma-70, region 4, partial [Candidatus Parcubacteria bacterium]